MRALSVRRASRFLIPAIGLTAVLAFSQAAGATSEPPTSPPGSEPVASEPVGTDTTGTCQPVGTEPVGTDTTGSEGPVSSLPEGYVWLIDDTGFITVAVPDTWTDIDTTPATDANQTPTPHVAAAPDLTAFRDTFDVPGVEFIAAPYTENPEEICAEFGLESGCAELTVEPYEDPVFSGIVQVGTECGVAGEATWNFIVASPEDDSFTAIVNVQAATEADMEALGFVLDSFNLAPAGAVPGSSVPGSSVVDTATDGTESDGTESDGTESDGTVSEDTGMTDATEVTETTDA